MVTQPTLFESHNTPYGTTYSAPRSPVVDAQHDDASIQARFAEWIAANPHVLDAFIARAMELKRAGRRRIGAKRIAEDLRAATSLKTDGDGWKINNTFVTPLARLAVQTRPELAPLFEFRS